MPNFIDIILVDLAGFFTLAVGHFLPVSSLYFSGWYPILLWILFGIFSDHTLENLRIFRDYLKATWDFLEYNPR